MGPIRPESSLVKSQSHRKLNNKKISNLIYVCFYIVVLNASMCLYDIGISHTQLKRIRLRPSC